MYSKDRHLVWVLLVTAGAQLLVRCCNAAEHVPGPSGRKLSHGLAAMHHNHLGLPSGDGSSESVKFSANRVPQHVPYAVLAPWRRTATVSTPLAGGPWAVRKPLAKPLVRGAAGGSRSRINNRSMTRFSEVEIPPGLEQQLDVPELQRPSEVRGSRLDEGTGGLVELYRSAERSRGIENLFWKYFVDNDVSASTEDEGDDNTGAEDAEPPGGIDRNAIDTQDGSVSAKEEEGRKKKFHLKKKYKKFLIPLLLAYKIKFLALVPAIIGGLILLVKSAGLAGFFFALFTAVVSLKKY
uniref:Transmembrane protein n=1 Tax=Anopheles gambiae TaxID=7165 RepID=A0A2C9H3S8_ANOGA